VVRALEGHGVSARLLLGDNLMRRPAYRGSEHRVIDEMTNSDFVMENVFWVGVYPGLHEEQIDFMLDVMLCIALALGSGTVVRILRGSRS
jgi:CDP-6-deoxy-D-xylo-4-hexulose-3-dehydrase